MDEFSTKNVSREFLRKTLDFLNNAGISYDFDGPNETLRFDITELSKKNQEIILKQFKPLNESMKPTKRQIQIAEHFVKRVLSEENVYGYFKRKFPDYELVQINHPTFDDPDYSYVMKRQRELKPVYIDDEKVPYHVDTKNKIVRWMRINKSNKRISKI
jgi:hypothetical protein